MIEPRKTPHWLRKSADQFKNRNTLWAVLTFSTVLTGASIFSRAPSFNDNVAANRWKKVETMAAGDSVSAHALEFGVLFPPQPRADTVLSMAEARDEILRDRSANKPLDWGRAALLTLFCVGVTAVPGFLMHRALSGFLDQLATRAETKQKLEDAWKGPE